jgi:ketosteroid isomerase-like protein
MRRWRGRPIPSVGMGGTFRPLGFASHQQEIIMKARFLLVAPAAAALLIAARPASSGDGKDGGPSGAFTYSSDAQVAAVQRQVKGVVERYQDGLNSSDFARIRPVFAPDAVAEWDEKATVIGVEAMAKPYEELFKAIKFNTDFQYDAVDVYGDVAIVRTHHPVGQTELHLKDGSKTLDFNREIFVLRRMGAEWKIILYTFNTQPRQGEQ